MLCCQSLTPTPCLCASPSVFSAFFSVSLSASACETALSSGSILRTGGRYDNTQAHMRAKEQRRTCKGRRCISKNATCTVFLCFCSHMGKSVGEHVKAGDVFQGLWLTLWLPASASSSWADLGSTSSGVRGPPVYVGGGSAGLW